ncbi:MAG: carbamoyl-phosphate synthase (glutamine-hydrolyzing) large subunit [Candidatus Altimarinota bacterium]
MYKKILILGSGALKIGEAGEFDYSGSQAIKALKEEGIKTILINPNIATVQTDPGFADELYLSPINPEAVEEIIKKEEPDGIMLSFGGQTALNCGLELEEKGVLKKYNIKVLGTSTDTIRMTEDRKIFNQALDQIGVKYARSATAESKKQAIKIAEDIGYPVLVRAAFALGGLGSGFAHDRHELELLLEKSFSYSHQVIIDESLVGWKELEYEVVRDGNNNCITVCNMENIDPMGIHTGESIVVAPSQTLSDKDHQMLRDIALKTIRHLNIIGECNIQFALDPHSSRYCVIEVNARLSRSSALASKVTGYPLAYVAAKISLGYHLDEIKNLVTGTTTAFFEPSLDYVVIKIPRWDLEKFEKVDQKIGSEMKSVGEVMAIGRNIEEALQKGFRNLDIGAVGLIGNTKDYDFSPSDLDFATPKRMFAIVRALLYGKSLEEIERKTHIDPFFLSKIQNLVNTYKILKETSNWKNKELLQRAKKQGFSDLQLSKILKCTEREVRNFRHENQLRPKINKIDTLAGEFPTNTNYLYMTYHGASSEIQSFTVSPKILIIGSGPYRIGSSVEFDWCSVSALRALKKMGYETIMLNFNPETVSTDFDVSDRLYFDEISVESISEIYHSEKPIGVIVSMGGQIANNLAMKLKDFGIPVLGTSPENIDRAEDGHKFSTLCDQIGVVQPTWSELTTKDEATMFGEKYGYPVIIRPSYVLSGANMRVCADSVQLSEFLEKATISKDYPTVISKFEIGAKEIEIDGVGKNGRLELYALSEHVENAGVHSGDATVIFPAQTLHIESVNRIKKITKKIIKELNITGPFNIQFLAKNDEIKVIECNLRASRSFPFVSKVSGYNFIEIAIRGIMGEDISYDYNTLDLDHVGIKAPQFSFHRLKGADPKLGIEMASTGEVGCIGDTVPEAFWMAMSSVGFTLKGKNILLSLGSLGDKSEFLPSARILSVLGYSLFATPGTSRVLSDEGIKNRMVEKGAIKSENHVLSMVEGKKFDLIINTPSNDYREEEKSGYFIRRVAVDRKITLITNIKLAKLFTRCIEIQSRQGKFTHYPYKHFVKNAEE